MSLLSPNGGSSLSTGTGNATGSGRTKVALKPGHSLMDWIRLCKKENDMAGTGGKVLKVTTEELAKHNTPSDCWIAVHGKVFNVTPYLDFHPGGVDELMKGAGKDATEIFNEVHPYVNFASMLKTCHVGDYTPKMSPLMDVQSSREWLIKKDLSPPY